MNGLILTGKNDEKELYLKELIKVRQIPSYNINIYKDTAKIADIRNLISKIAVTSTKDRIFIFEGELTHQAQNSLLKTLESLPDDVFIIFKKANNLLPTIISRCSIVRFGTDGDMSASDELREFSEHIERQNFQGSLVTLDGILEKQTVEEFVLGLRGVVLERVVQNKDSGFTVKLLDLINSKYSKIQNNNINSRLLIESSIVSCMREK